jgi:hypothetical protein
VISDQNYDVPLHSDTAANPPAESLDCQVLIDNSPLTPHSNPTHHPPNHGLLDQDTQLENFAERESLPTETNIPSQEPLSPPTQVNPGISSMRDRWLYPYLEQSPPGVPEPELKAGVVLMCRVFRTYPRMMSRRVQLPPFIHDHQLRGMVPVPLANCFALSRMWNGHTDVEGSANIVQSTIRAEMDRLFNEVCIVP